VKLRLRAQNSERVILGHADLWKKMKSSAACGSPSQNWFLILFPCTPAGDSGSRAKPIADRQHAKRAGIGAASGAEEVRGLTD